MEQLQAIVLAAGKSTRFKTKQSKLSEEICGQKMILYITQLLKNLKIPTSIIIGYQKESLQKTITEHHHEHINFIIQENQLGTGHALLCSRNDWSADHILIINGDMPLVSPSIIKELYNNHITNKAAISFVKSRSSSNSYGRVIQKNNTIKIIEARDFNGDFHEQSCINAGIYIATKHFLINHIEIIKKNKMNKEFYITELINIASKKNLPIAITTASFDQICGVNTLEELWVAEQIKRAELIKHWMKHGVRFSFPQNVHLDQAVSIQPGSFIGCGVQLLGNTTIGKNCIISPFSLLTNTNLGNHVTIHPHSVIENAHIDSKAQIGPFAHIRKNTHIKSYVTIGNFVETKNSTIGDHSKAKHLTYLGDTTLGKQVNIGAGTITCNFKGKNSKKEKTTIEDNVFIGSNNSLIAPITIHKNAYTAAGSVITDDVPSNALAIARTRQINKNEYSPKTVNVKMKEKGCKIKKKNKQSTNTKSFIAARLLTQEELSEEP